MAEQDYMEQIEYSEMENIIWDDSLSRWKIDITKPFKRFFGDTIKKAYALCFEDTPIEDVKQDAFYLYETIANTIEVKTIEFDKIDLLLTLSNDKTVEIWNADNSLTIEDFDDKSRKNI